MRGSIGAYLTVTATTECRKTSDFRHAGVTNLDFAVDVFAAALALGC